MKDYLKLHTNQASYNTWKASNSYVMPNVSLIEDIHSVMYNPLVSASYNFLDILWSDGTTTQTVRPTTDGVTPIGLCVAPTGFFGANEKARFMALKYASGSSNNAATGSTTYKNNQGLKWTLESAMTDIVGLTNYSQVISTSDDYWCWVADYQGNLVGTDESIEGTEVPIMLYTENDTWIGVESGNELTGYTLGDINGKQNTATISSLDSLSDYPAFASVLNYYTPGTQAGDWYLAAVGELAIICANQSRINAVLTSISNSYSSDCMSSITRMWDAYTGLAYWSSTENNDQDAWCIDFNTGYTTYQQKSDNYPIIPMLML